MQPRLRVGEARAPRATRAGAQGTVHLCVDDGDIVAHLRRWVGSPATEMMEDTEPRRQREGVMGSGRGEQMGVSEGGAAFGI